jgi:hypothetical protein
VRQRLQSSGLLPEVIDELASMVANEEGEDMGITDLVKGYKPQANEDVDFPPIKGEYKATVAVIRPEQTDGVEDRYHAQFKIQQTLTGDVADNRVLLRNYRFAGTNFDKSAITEEQAAKAVKDMANDAMTCGVDLDLSSDEALVASLATWLGKECYIRAWHFSPKDDPDRKLQMFVIKRERDLRKDSKATASGQTARAPF